MKPSQHWISTDARSAFREASRGYNAICQIVTTDAIVYIDASKILTATSDMDHHQFCAQLHLTALVLGARLARRVRLVLPKDSPAPFWATKLAYKLRNGGLHGPVV